MARKPKLLDAGLVIANNVIESFNGILVNTIVLLWLTLSYLPTTNLNPPSALAVYLAIEGLLVLPVFSRAGRIADKYAPHKVAELSQYLNIASMTLLIGLILLSSPHHPLATLLTLAIVQMTLMNRGILFDSSVMVIINSRVPEEKQPSFFTWNYRANLVTPLVAPIFGSWLFQHYQYVGIFVCVLLSLASALLLVFIRRTLVPEGAFSEKPAITFINYAREFTGRKSTEETQFTGFRSLKHLRFSGVILLLIAVEALGNRSRDSFDVFMVTDTFNASPTFFGFISTFMFVGMVCGTTAKSFVMKRWTQWWWPVLFYALISLSFLARGFAPTIWVFLAICGLNGFAAGLYGGIFEVAWVSNTDNKYLGAVSAAKSAFFNIVSTVGYLLWASFAWWGEKVSPTFMADYGYRMACILGGSLMLLGAVLSTRLFKNVDWAGDSTSEDRQDKLAVDSD